MEISNNAVIGIDLSTVNVRTDKVKDDKIESLVSKKKEKGDTDQAILERIAILLSKWPPFQLKT